MLRAFMHKATAYCIRTVFQQLFYGEAPITRELHLDMCMHLFTILQPWFEHKAHSEVLLLDYFWKEMLLSLSLLLLAYLSRNDGIPTRMFTKPIKDIENHAIEQEQALPFVRILSFHFLEGVVTSACLCAKADTLDQMGSNQRRPQHDVIHPLQIYNLIMKAYILPYQENREWNACVELSVSYRELSSLSFAKFL